MQRRQIWTALLMMLLATTVSAQQKKTRDEQVRDDKKDLAKNEDWIYNDLSKGIEVAKKAKKPLLVVFRCIP